MGLFSMLFKRKKPVDQVTNEPTENIPLKNVKCQQLLELKEYMDLILDGNDYIARSQYRNRLLESEKIIKDFGLLKSDGCIEEFCNKNGISLSVVESTLTKYNDFQKAVDLHNEEYIKRVMGEEKAYFDNMFQDDDQSINLNEEQRRAILTDEDRYLVVAGPGTGKTTTIAAKVKYLVEKKGISPEQILIISFTNNAAEKLAAKLNKILSANCAVKTLNSIGKEILESETEKRSVADDSKLRKTIQKYFEENIYENQSLVDNLVLFFNSYFDESEKKGISGYSERRNITIQNEAVRSHQEVKIANFLYENGIEYEYEKRYKYNISPEQNVYNPDFTIKQGDKIAYIEHFGITEDGRNDQYSNKELENYKKEMDDKIRHHREHGTDLIFTYSKYDDGKELLQHLQEELEKNGFEMRPRSNEEILEKMKSSGDNRHRKMIHLICEFIEGFREKGFSNSDFERICSKTESERTKFFVEKICQPCYLEYELYLKKENNIDFSDMINRTITVLQNKENVRDKLNYKYVIIDECQDLSYRKYELIKLILELTGAKMVAVGDDWQSIYGFAGADVSLMTESGEKMGNTKQVILIKNYRNAQEILKIAGNFVQRSNMQISKRLEALRQIETPVIIHTYNETPNSIADTVEAILGQIVETNERKGETCNQTVLVLGRYTHDCDELKKSNAFEVKCDNKVISTKYRQIDITFMTVHAAKGLEYDNVIVLNGKSGEYGFPRDAETDMVLAPVKKVDKVLEEAEERRLFYVAMTRSKNRVYFLAPKKNPSRFLVEIKNDNADVVKLIGEWDEERQQKIERKCPCCGSPLSEFDAKDMENKIGKKLYICTNQEKCGFETNDLGGGKLSICKCDGCTNGYLIVKKGQYGYYLGCTNYSYDKEKKKNIGCGKTIGKKQYYKEHNLPLE